MTDQVTRGPSGPDVAAVPASVGHAQPYASAQHGTGDEIAAIRAAFPGWSVWRSDEGRWWATRRCPLRPSRWPEGYALTVTADDDGALRSAMNSQPGEPGRDREVLADERRHDRRLT
jgi:hypothetical protein